MRRFKWVLLGFSIVTIGVSPTLAEGLVWSTLGSILLVVLCYNWSKE